MSDKQSSTILSFGSSSMDENAVRKIGGKLREKYNEVAAEPIPDRFMSLLDELSNSKPVDESDTQ